MTPRLPWCSSWAVWRCVCTSCTVLTLGAIDLWSILTDRPIAMLSEGGGNAIQVCYAIIKKKKILSHIILQFPVWLKEISHLQCIQNCVPASPTLGLARLHGSFFGIMFSVLSFLSFSSVLLFLERPSSLCYPPCLVALIVLLLASFSLFRAHGVSTDWLDVLNGMTKGHFILRTLFVVSIYTSMCI